MTRRVRWGALPNTWDFGGLPRRSEVAGTRETLSGRVYRSARLDDLDDAGWAELTRSVATVVDLRNDSEVRIVPLRPARLGVIRTPIEDEDDAEFMGEWNPLGSPRYYAAAVERWPDLFRRAFAAIAEAPEGGVLIHCAAGRDRTGQIAALLLERAGAERSAILDDYERAVRAANDHLENHPSEHDVAVDSDTLRERLVVARATLDDFLSTTSVTPFEAELSAAAARLTG
ncbi:MAG: tyrosine-protein phosphatase [Pseudolysinimonas sp.]|uniref:tyrosine-protein phosphatase n=1 Tax=Pseudolysinimonas sp. TaxID=2680009 RepID=UPI003265D153